MNYKDEVEEISIKKEDPIRLCLPLSEQQRTSLSVGQMVFLTGTLYTARDQAHLRMLQEIKEGKELPIPLLGAAIYYCGPTPARPGNLVGSIGPTTSSRMDKMTVPLLEKGLKLMIGKGKRSQEVVKAIADHEALYLSAIGGAGALYAGCITAMELVAYEDLMAEAIYRIEVKDFPAVVSVDSSGNTIF